MFFRLLHGPLCFEIPDEWWKETRADTFKPVTNCYQWSEPGPLDEVILVSLKEIAPPLRYPEISLDFHGLRKNGSDGGVGGMLGVLQAIVDGTRLPPVSVCKTRKTYAEGFNYKVKDGYHRFYASHAFGFTELPCVIGHDLRPEPMFGD
jgi:hypothetical protein